MLTEFFLYFFLFVYITAGVKQNANSTKIPEIFRLTTSITTMVLIPNERTDKTTTIINNFRLKFFLDMTTSTKVHANLFEELFLNTDYLNQRQ